MAWEATAFTEVQDFFYDDQYDSFCFGNFTATKQSVSGSRDDTAQVNGFRITFTGPIQPLEYTDTSCSWVDGTSIDVRFFGPSLNVAGEVLTLPITSNVATVDLEAEGANFQFLSDFSFTFFKKDVTTGLFVTSVEVDAAVVVADPFWTNYKNTVEVC